MRAVAGSGTPNRRNRSMPRPPLFGTTAASEACTLAQHYTTPHHASLGSQLPLLFTLLRPGRRVRVYCFSCLALILAVTANRFSTVP
jgi:hypothetical protein